MSITHYNPTNEIFEVEKEFNRIINNFERWFGIQNNTDHDDDSGNAVWTPLTDIYEDNDSYKLKLDLPGVEKDDVKITFVNNQISVAGERKQIKESENHKYHRIERNVGKFYRSFDLPKEINQGKISADFKNGQLLITIPKNEEVKPKQIEVKIN